MCALSLLWFVGCSGLFDIPDNPRLVVAPDASMPPASTEPTPANEPMPSPGDDAAPNDGSDDPDERPPEVGGPVAPAPDGAGESDTDGQNIENGRSDAGAAVLDAGVPPDDEPPPVPCAESGLVGPNGSCFVAASTLLSWADARLGCQTRGPGWDLASIRDGAVNQFMNALSPGEAWIGASDADDEGLWVWVGDGAAFWSGDGTTGGAIDSAFENWNSDEPNGRNNSACARLVFNANAAPNPAPAWADLECFELRPSVCEGPL